MSPGARRPVAPTNPFAISVADILFASVKEIVPTTVLVPAHLIRNVFVVALPKRLSSIKGVACLNLIPEKMSESVVFAYTSIAGVAVGGLGMVLTKRIL